MPFRNEDSYIHEGFQGKPSCSLEFCNQELGKFLAFTSEPVLGNCGITRRANRNWIECMSRGEIPTLKGSGKPGYFDTFEEFEAHVENLFLLAVFHRQVSPSLLREIGHSRRNDPPPTLDALGSYNSLSSRK